MKKQELLELLDQFPDEFDPDDLMASLYLKLKIVHAEAAVERGAVIGQQDVVMRSEQWFRMYAQ